MCDFVRNLGLQGLSAEFCFTLKFRGVPGGAERRARSARDPWNLMRLRSPEGKWTVDGQTAGQVHSPEGDGSLRNLTNPVVMIQEAEPLEGGREPEDFFPGSRRVYMEGSRPEVSVPMREVRLSPTRRTDDSEESNEPVRVYDTSGPWGDPAFHGDVSKWLPTSRSRSPDGSDPRRGV